MFVWTNVGSVLSGELYRECKTSSPTSIFLARLTRENGDGFVTRARRWYDPAVCEIKRAWAISETVHHPGYMKFSVRGTPWWSQPGTPKRSGYLYLRGVRLRSRIRWDAARHRIRALAACREVAALLLVTRRLGVRFSERDCGGVLLDWV